MIRYLLRCVGQVFRECPTPTCFSTHFWNRETTPTSLHFPCFCLFSTARHGVEASRTRRRGIDCIDADSPSMQWPTALPPSCLGHLRVSPSRADHLEVCRAQSSGSVGRQDGRADRIFLVSPHPCPSARVRFPSPQHPQWGLSHLFFTV